MGFSLGEFLLAGGKISLPLCSRDLETRFLVKHGTPFVYAETDRAGN